MHFGSMHIARCRQSSNQPKLLVWAPAGRMWPVGHQLVEQELSTAPGRAVLPSGAISVQAVRFSSLCSMAARGSQLVGRADGCRSPCSSASSLRWSLMAPPEAAPQLGRDQRGVCSVVWGFSSLASISGLSKLLPSPAWVLSGA